MWDTSDKQYKRVERLLLGLYVFIPVMFYFIIY